MKNALLIPLIALLTACGGAKTVQDTTKSPTVTADSVATASPAPAKPQNCRSVADADKLGKPLVYKESAKPLTFTLTLNQDTSTMQTSDGCYYNNTLTVLATKKADRQAFRRTLLKEDIAYFSKDGEAIGRSVLQRATYTPTFNSERYFFVTMRLLDPVSKKTKDYRLFMNYYGEIVKVK